MSKDNYFGKKFGPKVNPKVQKAQDSREAKESKRRMYQDSLNNDWEGKSTFDKNKKKGKNEFGGDRKFSDKKFDGERKFGDKKFGDKKFDGERKSFGDKKFGDKKFDGERKSFGDKKFGDKKFDGERKSFGDKKFGDKKFDGEKREFSGKKEFKTFKDKKGKDEAPKKKFGAGIFAKEKREQENFYTEEDRARLFGEEAFKDRVLKELSDEIDHDLDEMKRQKAISESKQRREKRENRKQNEEDYKITRYIDDEEDFEKAYKSYGGKKWIVEGTKKDREIEGEIMDEGNMPLNKYIAHCGVCSRRDAVSIIKSGKVTVDDVVVNEPGFKVAEDQVIKLDGKKITPQKNMVYILMNKPKGFITTTDDPKGRRTVMDLVENHFDERVFPVGRLDRNTTGLLLLTNDGELAQQLAHPKYEIRKIYHVVLDKNLSKGDFEKILNGVVLEDGPAPVDHVAYLESKNEIGIEIHSGKNRIVRRIFESLGYEVEKLDRVMYAGLTKKNIPRGKFRLLTKQEIINLKHLSK